MAPVRRWVILALIAVAVVLCVWALVALVRDSGASAAHDRADSTAVIAIAAHDSTRIAQRADSAARVELERQGARTAQTAGAAVRESQRLAGVAATYRHRADSLAAVARAAQSARDSADAWERAYGAASADADTLRGALANSTRAVDSLAVAYGQEQRVAGLAEVARGQAVADADRLSAALKDLRAHPPVPARRLHVRPALLGGYGLAWGDTKARPLIGAGLAVTFGR